MKISREVIGTFIVKTEKGENREVVVSQEEAIQYDKERSYTGKYFNLDNINGRAVFTTDEENIFRLADGSELRRRST